MKESNSKFLTAYLSEGNLHLVLTYLTLWAKTWLAIADLTPEEIALRPKQRQSVQ